MISQLEFDAIVNSLDPPDRTPRPIRRRDDLNATDYALGLAAAIHAHGLSPSAFNVLLSGARQQTRRGYATIPQTALDLRVSYQSIRHHYNTNPEWWTITRAPDMPHPSGENPGNFSIRATLTCQSIKLLASIQRQARTMARHTAAHTQT